MDSKETKQHVVSIQDENVVQSNKTPNDQAKTTTTSSESSVCRWLNFFDKHSSIERKAILLLSVAAVFLDPLFFYIPVVKNNAATTCLGLDNNLRIIVVVFRTFVDVLHTILWWHHSLSSLHRYRLILAWTVAILATLPLPQVVILAVSWQLLTVRLLKFIVLIQFVIRLCRIIPAYKDATRSSDMLLIYTWFAAAFNLVMYTLASNILGAFWYLRAVERNMDCWRRACHKNQTLCDDSSLYCGYTSTYKEYLHTHCSIPQASNTTFFDYGIYDEAFHTVIIETDTPFLDKFFQCFWWGLRNLSSLGQNLKTGTYIWDSFFAISIAICGLVLFAFLIGNMQTYLQTRTPSKLERMKQRKIYLEGWSPFYLLPNDLRRKVTWCEDPKWQETTEVNLESLLNNIPTSLRKKIRPYLCNDLFSKVKAFEELNPEVKRELWERATPVVFQARSIIHNEGSPIHEMIHIVHGKALAFNNMKEGSRNLKNNDCVGKELLEKALESPLPNLPLAAETIQSLTKVEAFALSFDVLDAVFTEYRSLYPSYQERWAEDLLARAFRRRRMQSGGRNSPRGHEPMKRINETDTKKESLKGD